MSQASGSDVSVSAQMKPNAENDANDNGRSGVSENKEHVRKDGQNVNASFGTSSQMSDTASGHIQNQTKNLPVDRPYSEKCSMMPQKVFPALEKNAQQSSGSGSPGNERAAVHSFTRTTSDAGQLKTHSSGDKLPEAMETSMKESLKGNGETWQPPTCPNDMNDVEMEDVEEKKSRSLEPDKTAEDQRNYRAEVAKPKTETDRKPQKPWKEFFVIVKQAHGSDFEILEKCSAKDRELSPVKMQYLIQYHFEELLKTFDVDLQKIMHNMKPVQCNSQCLLFDVRSAPTQRYIDEIIVCLQDTANKVNYFQRFPASKAFIDNPETVLKEFILSGQIAVYRDEEATYVVGIVEDNKIITEKLKMMLVDESMNSNYHTTTVELKMDTAGQLLKTFGFMENLNMMQPNTTFFIDEEKHTISFRGRQTEVESAADEVGKFFRGLVIEDITLHPMYLKLLLLPKVKEFLVDLCRTQNLKVFWTVSTFNSRITCYMLNGSGVQLFLDMLKQNLVIYNYAIRSQSSNEIAFSSTKMFVDFVDAHYNVNLVSLVEGNNICIATIKDVGNELVIMEAKHTDKKPRDDSKKSVEDGKSQGLTRQKGNVEAFDDDEYSIIAEKLWDLQKIQMLKKFNFGQQIKRKIPDIKITISDKQITFVGVEAKKVKQEIADFMSKLDTQTVDKIPSAVLDFCKTSEVVQQRIASSFDKNGILCHWYVNDDCDCLNVFALDGPTLSTAISHILKIFKWIEYTSTDDVKFIFKSQEIMSFLEKSKRFLKVDDIECDDFMVYGITEAVEEFGKLYDSKMEAFVKQQKLLYPKYDVKVVRHRLGARKDVVEFFTKHEHSMWKFFLNDYCIKVEVDDDGEVLLVGEEDQVKNAAREFNRKVRLTRKKWSCDVNYPKEVVQKLKVDTVPSIEREFKVSLTVENDTTFFQQQQLGQWVDWNSNIHVALVHGKVYEMVADVLVCPTNGSFSPSSLATVMLEKGGIIMKNDFSQKRIKQANAIYVSSYTGNLPCLMVAYLAVPEYRPSVTMQSEVKKCIQELILAVDKAQLQSIVIPVKILDHIPETTFLHWFASAFIAIHNQLNFLKQIYLCTDFTKNTELFVEALSSSLPKYLNFYNFSHMCGEIGQENVGAVIPIDMKIELVTGMLVEQKVDVIVNSCNRQLDLAKGAVSSTIMKKGGHSILHECQDNYPNGIDYGNVVVSSAGNMEFHMICHGALPFWTPAAKLSLQLLAKLVFDCLLEAEKNNCRSIAFPVFGTGNLEYPWDEVARTMLDTINKYGTLRSGITTVKEVKIVLYEKDVKSIKAFESRKRQIEEIKLITEDPEIPPQLILEARCQNVRVQVIPLSNTKCHRCEAVVKFLSFAETNSLSKICPLGVSISAGKILLQALSTTLGIVGSQAPWTWTLGQSTGTQRVLKGDEAMLHLVAGATKKGLN
ncbi:unnamed protein product [Mytilus coruscus]|uniref:Macro domain-containing protein n=1 Tax=Mytilus coruscus TaxID=42192 RepID=A0A6J8CBH8_MYTCO|nr:unnamed protein product [Mytilus coruscus]